MSINFDALLSNEQKKAILEQRIQQFAVEAYQINLNKRVAVKNADEQAVADADKNLEVLESAINTYLEELDGIPQAEVAE